MILHSIKLEKIIPILNHIFNGTKKLACFLWDLFGFRFISTKLITPVDTNTGKRKPITITLWIIGFYVAMYGVASQRYENRIDIIENRVSSIYAQLASPKYRKALSRVPSIQHMLCPRKPDILRPMTVLESLFAVYDIAPYPENAGSIEKPSAGIPSNKSSEILWNFRRKFFKKEEKNAEIVELLKAVIEDWKDSLKGIDLDHAILDGVNLENADFSEALMSNAEIKEAWMKNTNFHKAKLWNTDLSNSFLEFANFNEAELINTQFDGAELSNASFQDAKLDTANFKEANLKRSNFENAKLKNATFEGANLIGAKGLEINQLITTRNLHKAIFDKDILKKLEKNYAFLLLPPDKRTQLVGSDFQGKYLVNCILERSNLSNSNFSHANLRKADLSSAMLENANLSNANLWNADLGSTVFRDAKLIGTDLRYAQCWNTNFSDADFKHANLIGANIRKADFSGAKNLSIVQICNVETCYESKFDTEILKKIKAYCPEIIEEPSYR